VKKQGTPQGLSPAVPLFSGDLYFCSHDVKRDVISTGWMSRRAAAGIGERKERFYSQERYMHTILNCKWIQKETKCWPWKRGSDDNVGNET